MKFALILLSMNFLAHAATYQVTKRSITQTVYTSGSELILSTDDNANVLCVREGLEHATSMTTAKASTLYYVTEMGSAPKMITKAMIGKNLGAAQPISPEDMDKEVIRTVECEKRL